MDVNVPTDDDAYGENTALVDVLGNHPKTKILAVLLGAHNRDLNPSDIARLAGIERSTFYAHKDALLAYNLIKQTRKVGNSKMYQINTDNEAAKALAAFEWELLDELNEDGRPSGLEAA